MNGVKTMNEKIYEVKCMTAQEDCKRNDYDIDVLSLDGKTPMLVYYSDTDSAYVGVQYTDGSFGVIGAKFDSIVDSATTMIHMIVDEY